MKPVILITSKPAPDDFGIGGINKTQTNYCYAINQAGGLPIVSAWGDAQQYAQIADGILFTGSAYDISPELYHQENRNSKDCKMDLDEMELALFDAFYRAGKPIMGICRGLQLINVAMGGSLIQDIPDEVEALTVHQKVYQKETTYHPVTAKEDCLFYRLFGKDFTTNSYHHQAIGACAPGLVATVTTEEGIIEAVEHETKPIFATQWHPERMVGQEQTDLPSMLPLFCHFIELCKKLHPGGHIMMNIPKNIFSGSWKEGHVQGIAVDTLRGFVYYSFTTILLKTDLEGNPLATVENLIGHLGCIAYDKETNRLYGSLELKHDVIGRGIMERTGRALAEEDAFYLVSFDLDRMDRMGMDAEKDDIVKAVYVRDVLADYSGIDDYCGMPRRYGCGGMDGVSVGPIFGAAKDSPRKIMLAEGICRESYRTDNDHQVILQYDPSIFDQYGQPLDQLHPHHSGPDACEARYFFYTGNTTWGIQNLEYDPYTGYWFVAVYAGIKPEFENFKMFAIDGNVPAKLSPLEGRGDEKGLLLTSAKIGVGQKEDRIYGSHFAWGSTGIAALGDGTYCISHQDQSEDRTQQFTNIKLYRFDPSDPNWFLLD